MCNIVNLAKAYEALSKLQIHTQAGQDKAVRFIDAVLADAAFSVDYTEKPNETLYQVRQEVIQLFLSIMEEPVEA